MKTNEQNEQLSQQGPAMTPDGALVHTTGHPMNAERTKPVLRNIDGSPGGALRPMTPARDAYSTPVLHFKMRPLKGNIAEFSERFDLESFVVPPFEAPYSHLNAYEWMVGAEIHEHEYSSIVVEKEYVFTDGRHTELTIYLRQLPAEHLGIIVTCTALGADDTQNPLVKYCDNLLATVFRSSKATTPVTDPAVPNKTADLPKKAGNLSDEWARYQLKERPEHESMIRQEWESFPDRAGLADKNASWRQVKALLPRTERSEIERWYKDLTEKKKKMPNLL